MSSYAEISNSGMRASVPEANNDSMNRYLQVRGKKLLHAANGRPPNLSRASPAELTLCFCKEAPNGTVFRLMIGSSPIASVIATISSNVRVVFLRCSTGFAEKARVSSCCFRAILVANVPSSCLICPLMRALFWLLAIWLAMRSIRLVGDRPRSCAYSSR